jgi:hypothetical protein
MSVQLLTTIHLLFCFIHGAGPAICVMISSPMLDRLRKEGFGIEIKLDDGKTLVIPAFAFVDDVDLIQEIKDHDWTLPQK